MCIEIDKLKDRVYDEFYSLFGLCESRTLNLSVSQDLYLIYHKVGTSRRFDFICYQQDSAYHAVGELLAIHSDIVYYIVRFSMALSDVAKFNSVNID